MIDRISVERRSWLMSRVKSQNTIPEMIVRSTLHALDYRYTLHQKKLPGSPDLVFPRKKKIIFVHGCYWHGHYCRQGRAQSKSNVEFWSDKIVRNIERDVRNVETLEAAGWKILVLWECEIKNSDWISKAIHFLESSS